MRQWGLSLVGIRRHARQNWIQSRRCGTYSQQLWERVAVSMRSTRCLLSNSMLSFWFFHFVMVERLVEGVQRLKQQFEVAVRFRKWHVGNPSFGFYCVHTSMMGFPGCKFPHG